MSESEPQTGIKDAWYALWVSTGKEMETIQELNRKGAACQWIYPVYVRKKKYLQAWHDEEKPMFPGYVFFTDMGLSTLQVTLANNYSNFARILSFEKKPVPLRPQEVEFIRQITVPRDNETDPHISVLKVECSYGFMENDQIFITQGPLRNHEALIKKIDRHKRLATVEITMLGRPMTVDLSLEIVYKKLTH